MHLQIAAILAERRSAEVRIVKDPNHLSPTEKVRAQRPAPLDVGPASADVDRPLDCGRGATLEHFADDPRGARTNPGDPRERIFVLAQQIGQRFFQAKDGRGGALVAEHLRLRRLRVRQISQISANQGVHVSRAVGREPVHLGRSRWIRSTIRPSKWPRSNRLCA
jgi:hypothetical protein